MLEEGGEFGVIPRSRSSNSTEVWSVLESTKVTTKLRGTNTRGKKKEREDQSVAAHDRKLTADVHQRIAAPESWRGKTSNGAPAVEKALHHLQLPQQLAADAGLYEGNRKLHFIPQPPYPSPDLHPQPADSHLQRRRPPAQRVCFLHHLVDQELRLSMSLLLFAFVERLHLRVLVRPPHHLNHFFRICDRRRKAGEARSEKTADDYVLIVRGPLAQSVFNKGRRRVEPYTVCDRGQLIPMRGRVKATR